MWLSAGSRAPRGTPAHGRGPPGRSPGTTSGARHGVDLRGAGGQGTGRPALAAVLAGEDLAAAARTVHAPGLARVERDREHRGPGLDAHVHPGPAGAAVGAAEQ